MPIDDLGNRARARLASLLAVLLAGAAALACAPSGASEAEPSGGEVTARWEGDTMRVSLAAPGTARWCAAGRWLEVAGVRGDTGILMAIFTTDSLSPGVYPVALPVRDDSLRRRPGSTVGIRWFVPGLVLGYRGFAGELELTAVDTGLGGALTVSGRLAGQATPAAGDGSIVLEGEFRDVPVAEAPEGCAPGP